MTPTLLDREKLKLVFGPGADRLADLLTQALPSSRTEEFVQLWGMRNFDSASANLADLEVRPQTSAAVDRVALYALLGLLQIRPTQGARDETRDLQLDGCMEFYFVAGMAVLCLLAVWNG